jgi:hypothetical protein
MTVNISITIDDVIDAYTEFLVPYVDGANIARNQGNRVAMPAPPCIMLNEILNVDIETPVVNYGDDEDATITSPKRIDLQVDFYGQNAGDLCAIVKGVYRSEYATLAFPDGIKPLYCSDGNQHPLITGEDQYLNRWTLTASLQYNPVVSVVQQSATALEATVKVPVDLT